MAISHSEFISTDVPMLQFALSLRARPGLPNVDQHRQTIILAQRVAAGTQTVDTVSTDFIDSGEQADTLAGAGSMAAIMCRRYLAHRNSGPGVPKSPLKLAVVDDSSAGSPVAATGVLTFGSGPSTAIGTWVFKIGGHLLTITLPSGSDVTAHAAAFKAAFNNLSWDDRPPFTADNAAGVLTLTATHVGVELNGVGVETITDPGAGVTDTWTAAATAGGADGSTGVALATVLAALATVPGQIVMPYTDDTKQELLTTHLITKGNATNKIRCRGVMANNDTYANLITWLGTIDDNNDSERVTAVCIEGSKMFQGEVAAIYAGCRASESHLARSLNGIRLDQINAPATGDVFTQTELQALLEAGGTPLEVKADSGKVSVVRDICCRSDLGILDGAAMDVYDYTRDYLGGLVAAAANRASIVESGAVVPAVQHIITEDTITHLLYKGCKDLEAIGYLTKVDENWDNTQTELSGSTVSVAFPAEMVPQLHGIKVRQDSYV